jgi:uncharacterized protein YciI
MKFFALVAFISVLATLASAHEDKVWLMYFMKGSVKSSSDPAEGQKAMQGHLGNMKKQATLGRLFAAGPLQDPTEQRRGITVVTAHDRKEIDTFFKADPFVKAGIMTVDAAEWKVNTARFNPKVDETGISEYRLVLIGRGKGMSPETKAMRQEHEKLMRSIEKEMNAIWGAVDGLQGAQEAMIVEGKDDAAIKAKLALDPLLKKSILEAEIVPLWMSKGILKPIR